MEEVEDKLKRELEGRSHDGRLNKPLLHYPHVTQPVCKIFKKGVFVKRGRFVA